MNVQSTWHILYYNKADRASEWKYFGQWPGDNEIEAITKSKIDGAVALTAIRVYSTSGGKRFARSGWTEQVRDD
jgi:hypothetical protein